VFALKQLRDYTTTTDFNSIF